MGSRNDPGATGRTQVGSGSQLGIASALGPHEAVAAPMSFHDWYATWRHSRNLTMQELAVALGYSKDGARKYLRPRIRPGRDFAARLAAFLGLSGEKSAEFRAFVTGAASEVSQPVADWIVEYAQPSRVASARTNLPSPLTRLIGRDQEVQELSELLTGRVRLLTFTGAPGCGKTRLAIAVAQRMRTAFRDGVFFVELAAVEQPEGIARAIADALRLKDSPDRSLLDTLTDYLKTKHLLLVIDNLEQLVNPAGPAVVGIAQHIIGGLLRGAAHVKVLATSRVKLRITGERLYLLEPFSFVDLASLHQPDSTLEHPAVELFLERARDAQPLLGLDSAVVAAVAQICNLLEGIPLAIELAAARCDAFTPQVILSQMHERSLLDPLQDGPLDQQPHHRTLRAAIDWSFGLLDPRCQQFYARIGVFSGGFGEAAAAAIAGAGSGASAMAEHEVRELLCSLVDASLLGRTEREGAGRYALLETLRVYALEQLDARGLVREVSRLHAMYYVQFASGIEARLVGQDQASWLAVCEAEHPNVQSALGWLLDTHEMTAAAQLAGALWRFWLTHGHLASGRAWFEAILRTDVELSPELKARALTGGGVLSRTQRAFDRARELLLEALVIWKKLGNVEGAALAVVNLGIVAEQQMLYEPARDLYVEALGHYRALNNERGEAHVLNNLSVVAIDEGQFVEAAKLAHRSLDIFLRRNVDPWSIALAQRNLGWIAMAQRQYDEAHRWLDASLEISQQLADPESTANVLNNLGLLAYLEATDEPGYRLAATYARRGFRMLHELGDRLGMAESLEILAACSGQLDAPEIAARGFGAAEALRTDARTFLFPSQRDTYRAMVARARQHVALKRWDALVRDAKARPDEVIVETLTGIGPGSSARNRRQVS